MTDFNYLLNPPLSVGTSINGFVKMVRRSYYCLALTISPDYQNTFGHLFDPITDRGGAHCFDLQ